jgi:hypothetical protein
MLSWRPQCINSMQQLGRCRCAVAGLEFKSQRQQHRHLSTQHPDPPPPSPNTTNTHSHSRSVLATSRTPYHDEARSIGVQFYTDVDDFAEEHPDVVVLATSILSTEAVLRSLPLTRLKRSTLVVDVLSVKARQSGTRTLSLCWGTSRLSCQPTTGLACLTLPYLSTPYLLTLPRLPAYMLALPCRSFRSSCCSVCCRRSWTCCAHTPCLALTAARAVGRGST